jgi:hypothetical protein
MPRVVAEFKVSLTDAGQIQVEGPIEQRMLAYGMFSVAMDVVRETSQQTNKVQLAPAGLANLFKDKEKVS